MSTVSGMPVLRRHAARSLLHEIGPVWICGTAEGRLTILFYAFGADPEGPFKRGCTVGSPHELRIYCTGCGEPPDPASARLLEAVY